jgi:CBS domain-containing protein
MFLADLLPTVVDRMVTAGPDETVAEVSRRLGYRKRGMAVVCDPNAKLLGVVSVMDIVRALGDHEAEAPLMRARAIMKTDPVVASPQDTVEAALDVMSEHGIRHLPVVSEEILRGVVDIRTLLEARSRAAEMTAEELSKYVYGAGYP